MPETNPELQTVHKILACYPNRKNVSVGYVDSLLTVLRTYPLVAQRAADPTSGVVRDCKFVPTPAELIAWCEKEMEIINRRDRWRKLASETTARCEEDDYWQRARSERPTYDDMRAHYGHNWGITVPDKTVRAYRSLTDDDLRKAYPPKES